MRFAFNEEKAAEAAAHLLVRAGGRLPYMSLIKYLYLADRDALVDRGSPITGDRLVAMAYGPVLSRVLDLLNEGPSPSGPSPWFTYVSAPRDYEVTLLAAPPEDGHLSDYELETLASVFDRVGPLGRWELSELTHHLPEWSDPRGSSTLIDPGDILRLVGRADKDVQAIVEEAEHIWLMDRRLAPSR